MTPFVFPETVEPAHAKRVLATLLEQAFESAQKLNKPRRVIRCEVPVDGVEPLAWLEAQGDRSRGYWCDRQRSFELAGVGTADIITAETLLDYDALFDHLHGSIERVHEHLHYYGGMRFSLTTPPFEKWLPFGAYRFVLPRFEVLGRGEQTYLACNVILRETDGDMLSATLQSLDAMPFPGSGDTALLPKVESRTDSPDQWEWAAEVERALGGIHNGEIEKVVLARETVFTFDQPIDPVALLRRLSPSSAKSYRFCFQPKPGVAFIGVSPERLYKRQDQFIRTEAVAGTCPATGDDAIDTKLANELLQSDKNRREHRYVLNAIRDELASRCHAVHADADVSVMRLARYQHLYAKIEAILDEKNTDAELLRSLHPTPAVGGVPTETALEWIATTEPFDRGWYAGPVGWVGCDTAEFAVAIRSALITDNTLAVYAGAGIVDGSIPLNEWNELENKIGPYTAALDA